MQTANSLAGKLVRVMDECNYIQKDQTNSFHKYKYVSAAAVQERVNGALVKHGIATVVTPEIISSETVTNSKGVQEKFVTVKTTITLLDQDSDQTLKIVGLGSGQDVGDKAIAKAQTMGMKYAWVQSLNISTGDDPEQDAELDERHSLVNVWNERFSRAHDMAAFLRVKSEFTEVFKRLSPEERQQIQEAAERTKERLGGKK